MFPKLCPEVMCLIAHNIIIIIVSIVTCPGFPDE
jgi:hypothetical protein